MLKCFFVISVVIPCEAEGPDKAFNCVWHAVCRGGQACAFHPAPGEAQPRPLSGWWRSPSCGPDRLRVPPRFCPSQANKAESLPFGYRGSPCHPQGFPPERSAERVRGLPVLRCSPAQGAAFPQLLGKARG